MSRSFNLKNSPHLFVVNLLVSYHSFESMQHIVRSVLWRVWHIVCRLQISHQNIHSIFNEPIRPIINFNTIFSRLHKYVLSRTLERCNETLFDFQSLRKSASTYPDLPGPVWAGSGPLLGSEHGDELVHAPLEAPHHLLLARLGHGSVIVHVDAVQLCVYWTTSSTMVIGE